MRLRGQFLSAATFVGLLVPVLSGEVFPLRDVQGLVPHNVKLDAVDYKGRRAVRVSKSAEGDGLAVLPGASFDDGTIEADVAVRLTTPPGERNPGFIGIAFRSQADALHYDMFYIRPGNSHAEDQAMRNHSVQYVATPGADWYRLRRTWPWLYEAYADLQLETWTHIKIEVAGRRARLYVNGASSPALIVDGLKGDQLRGAVGLWGSPGQESYFSNVNITHAKPQAIQNGGEAAGNWQLSYSSDVGNYTCQMKLTRSGNAVSGTWSGMLGDEVPVAGTWRDGYVELSFQGMWTKRDAGAAAAVLAGWFDGNSARGRLKIEGRADGQWTATRKDSF